MNRIAALALIVAMIGLGIPVPAAAAQARTDQTPLKGTITGKAMDRRGEPLSLCSLRLRNIASGQVIQVAGSDAAGQFTFQLIPVGEYLVEIVDSHGNIIATSPPVSITDVSPVIADVPIVSPEEVGEGCSVAGGAYVPKKRGGFFKSTAGMILIAAASAGIVAAATSSDCKCSPSK